MKNILSKVIASSMALTLVLASAVTTTSNIKTEEIPVKAPAAVHETVKPAAAEEEKGLGLIEAIEQKVAEEAVVEVVKAAPEIKEEKAAPEIREEKAAPVLAEVAEVAEEVAAPAAVIEETEEIAAEAEPVKVWDVSATENDNVSMKFYADQVSVNADTTTGEVVISGTGAMEEAVYTNFMSKDSYLAAVETMFEDYYGVEVELVYDSTIDDLIELDRTIKVKEAGTDNELVMNDEIRDNMNPADFLKFSPKRITINEGITSVSDYAFLACSDLVDITLPKSVKEIAPSAFQYCTGLQKVIMHEDTVIKAGAFYNCFSLTTVLRLSDADYANLANGMSAQSLGTALTVEEVNNLIEGV